MAAGRRIFRLSTFEQRPGKRRPRLITIMLPYTTKGGNKEGDGWSELSNTTNTNFILVLQNLEFSKLHNAISPITCLCLLTPWAIRKLSRRKEAYYYYIRYVRSRSLQNWGCDSHSSDGVPNNPTAASQARLRNRQTVYTNAEKYSKENREPVKGN